MVLPRRGVRRCAALSLLALGLLPVLSACRDATQITLKVRTNLPCSGDAPWQGVALYVGDPGGDVEQASATLVTKACDETGSVGSLVVTPSGAKDGEVGLRVVAGVTTNPEKCAASDYQGCVVARRALRFTPHDALELDVELTADCVSVGCDAQRTCLSGSCIQSRDVPVTPPEPVEVTGPSVRCGDQGVRCATEGDVCCLAVDAATETSVGDCRPVADCPSTSVVLYCDDDSDCDPWDDTGDNPTGKPGICNLNFEALTSQPWLASTASAASCRYLFSGSLGTQSALGLCEERKGCADGQFQCRRSRGAPTNPLPNYFWCELFVE